MRDHTFWVSLFSIFTSVITAYATFFSFRIQKARVRAKVFFNLIREGDRIIPELINTGSEIAKDIRISTNPSLTVADEIDRDYEGERELLTPNMIINGVQALLPGKVIREYGFSAKAFRNQFVNYRTIVVTITYLSENKKYTDMYPVDLSNITYYKHLGYY